LRGNVNASNISSFNGLRNQMSLLLVQENAFWHQRTKTHWMRDGDLNVKFFHVSAYLERRLTVLHL